MTEAGQLTRMEVPRFAAGLTGVSRKNRKIGGSLRGRSRPHISPPEQARHKSARATGGTEGQRRGRARCIRPRYPQGGASGVALPRFLRAPDKTSEVSEASDV